MGAAATTAKWSLTKRCRRGLPAIAVLLGCLAVCLAASASTILRLVSLGATSEGAPGASRNPQESETEDAARPKTHRQQP